MKLTAIAAALSLVGLVAYWQWSGRRRTGWMVLAGLVLVPSAYFAWRQHTLELRLSEVVEQVSGRTGANANCQGFMREFRLDNNLGEVAFDGKGGTSTTAQVRGGVCSHLRSFIGGGAADPSEDQTIAVHVLTHEAIHVSGITSEAETECVALQRSKEAAIMLGAAPETARAMGQWYWNEVFPRMPGTYRAKECFEDGDLDLSPGDGIWPRRNLWSPAWKVD
ncbi:MAG: hypothetical protein GY708_07245 [Actinomycetia bacterium]|nr:hypothetical protein [Actinomycetes bacterium]MCP4963321.1 hypothetical protein [Actinomycetes bacterium]